MKIVEGVTLNPRQVLAEAGLRPRLPSLAEATMKMPTSVDDWQLFRGEKGVGNAARGMTSALKRAEKAAIPKLKKARGRADAEKILRDVMNKIMYPAMDKFADQGASDTEPRGVAQDYLEKLGQQYVDDLGYVDF